MPDYSGRSIKSLSRSVLKSINNFKFNLNSDSLLNSFWKEPGSKIMRVSRKILALSFACLVVFFTATYYSTARNILKENGLVHSENLFFVSTAEQASIFILQHKSSPTPYQGWKTEVRFPCVWASNQSFCESPQRKVIRKILVINAPIYTPCKTLIIFPFHEFS